MKKIITSFFALITLTSLAQIRIEYVANLGENVNYTTISKTAQSSVLDMETDLLVINEGLDSIELKVRTTEMDVCDSTYNATCWNLCPAYTIAGAFPIKISSFSEIIASEDTAFSFAAHYKPSNRDCCSMIKYEWLDVDDSDAVVGEVIVWYDHSDLNSCVLGVEEEVLVAKVSISPNPAIDLVSVSLEEIINYDEISIDIFDLLGKKVSSVSQVGPKNNLNVSGFNNGVYFISIMKNGVLIKTSKLIKE